MSIYERVLREDKRAIFKASDLGAKAADYLRAKADEFELQPACAGREAI